VLSTNTFPQETRRILKLIPSIIKKTFPIPTRFRGALPSNIAKLSHLLTDTRGNRTLSYLGQAKHLSAYLHYFLPWNIYRLCIILQNEKIVLNASDTITDLGSGPLTFICALWITRPDLRNIRLNINCIDRSSPAMEAGKYFFNALCLAAGNNESPWKINLIRKNIDIRRTGTLLIKKPSALVCAVNMFNEIYENIPHTNNAVLKQIAVNAAALMRNRASENAYILTVEPGVPQSGKFISFLRTAFLEIDCLPISPCPHTEVCPCCGRRWCHFAFEAIDAPKELQQLSIAAKIPKERLVFSYLLTGTVSKINQSDSNSVRIISDAFPLPKNRFGRYGCSSKGLILLVGVKNRIEKMASGSLINSLVNKNKRDVKSGALIMEIE
jgi:ribosomal protein RSM22 (predicted rRNA methylase)